MGHSRVDVRFRTVRPNHGARRRPPDSVSAVKRWGWWVLVPYLGFLASTRTGLYEPFLSPQDDRSWLLLLVWLSSQIAVGVMVRSPWVLAVPVVVTVGAFFAQGAEALAWLFLVEALPVLTVMTLIGRWVGKIAPRHRAGIAVGLFALSAVPGVLATVETLQRGSRVPPAVQARLPTKQSLADLCSSEDALGQERSDLHRRGDALVRELRAHPNRTVVQDVVLADSPETGHRTLTVRRLGREQLAALEAIGGCEPKLRQQIGDALSREG